MGHIQHIFLTGVPGCGKSTLCRKVVESGLEAQWQGFFTGEVREHGERIGFDVITIGEGAALKGPLARVPRGQVPRSGPSVGKYSVDVSSFERLALPALQLSSGSLTTTRLVLVDEVGKMELCSRVFFPAVRAVLDAPNVVVLGTIPTPRDGRVIPQVAEICARPDVEVITVTRDNRDALAGQLAARLRGLLQALPPLPPLKLQPPPPAAAAPGAPACGPSARDDLEAGSGADSTSTAGVGSHYSSSGRSSFAGSHAAHGAGQPRAGGARVWSARLGAAGSGSASAAAVGAQAQGRASGNAGGWGQRPGAGSGSGVKFVSGSGNPSLAKTGVSGRPFQ